MLDWIELLAIILLNGLVDVLLVAWVAGKRSKQALVAYLESDQSDEMFDNVFKRMWTRLKEPSINRKRKVQQTDDKGNLSEAEVDEVISPLMNITEILTTEVARIMMLKLSAMEGGKAAKLRRELQEAAANPNNPGASSLQGLLALAGGGRKGLSIESLATALLAKYLFKEGGGSAGGGGQGSW
jgi:hypothetical protein